MKIDPYLDYWQKDRAKSVDFICVMFMHKVAGVIPWGVKYKCMYVKLEILRPLCCRVSKSFTNMLSVTTVD